jgi:hypothetical protein
VGKPKQNKYQSVELLKAVSQGWATLQGLTPSETTLLLFIAQNGSRYEPGMAFVFYPLMGPDAWADMLSMSRASLFRSRASLIKKGLLIKVYGSVKLSKWPLVVGWGMTAGDMDDCMEWVASRKTLTEALRDVQDKIRNNVTTTIHDDMKCSASLSPETESLSPDTGSLSPDTLTPPLTCGNATISKEVTKESKQPLTWARTSCAQGSKQSSQPSQEVTMHSPDGWGVPKDEREDAERFGKSKDPKTKTPPRVSTRLMDLFHDEWLSAREEQRMLPIDFSTRGAFAKNLNQMLEEYTEEQIADMMRAFFRQVLARKVTVRSPELWRDFLSAKAVLWRIIVQQGTTPGGVEVSGVVTSKSGRSRSKSVTGSVSRGES